MSTATKRRLSATVATSAVAALALTACASVTGNGDEDGNGGEDGEAPEVSTTVPDEEVSLSLAYVDDPPAQALIEGFTEKYPNVTIDPQQTPFSDYVKLIRLSMSSDDPPDIAQYNPGAMSDLIPAGHILNLDPYAEAYGWDETFPASSLEQLQSDDEAQQYGTGSLYAAPGALSVVGVFYNKAILEDVGVEVPQTLDEFEAALGQVADTDVRPLSLGALEVGGIHLWGSLLNVLGDPDKYREWVYGTPDATIETDAAAQAAETITEWVGEGYIAEAANATSDNDAQAAFASGDSAFLVTGNWAAAALSEDMGDDVGFFLMPGPSPDTELAASGSAVAYSVSAGSEHPDVAAAFLDYLASPEAAQVQLDEGFMPVNTDAPAEAEGLIGEINDGFGTVLDQAGIAPFPDAAAPGMLDELTPGLQQLIAGTLSVEDYLASLQEEWNEHRG